ncbi:MAG: autotransporter-associated beta strand repeat-containing protein, partial [Akkermansiaceae bacterium]|nr:autotransporter-associated beta strand repeat-containing protein [Akkermansiaceae bacterium]
MPRTPHPFHRGSAGDTRRPHACHTPLVRAALLPALAVLGCGQALADFTLVEDFESHTPGAALTAKGNWFAQAGINPATGGTIIFEGSRCARILGGSNNGCYYLPLGANAIADDTTGTLFFRFRSEPAQWLQIAAYLTSWQPTAQNWWDHDQAGFYSRWNIGDGTALRPRWSSGDNTRDVVGGTWYNVWIVADNAANTYSLYLSQGTDPATGGASSITVATGIPFRYASDALGHLYFADPDGNSTTGILLDDIHVDTGGANLANPWTIPVPPDSFTRPGVTTAEAANLGSGLTSTFGVGTGGDLVTIVNPDALSIAATHTIDIVPLSGITPSTYTLIDYDGALGGSGFEGLALGALPHLDAELQHNTTDRKIELVVHSVSTIYWDGDGGNGDWDTNTTPNWFEDASNDNEKFLPYDAVQFDDAAATYTDGIIRVAGTVTPRSVTFSHEANAYTLTGGTVSSAGGLTKSGGATLTLLNPNEFGVESVVTGGTLVIGDGATGSLAGNISIGSGAEVILNPVDGSTYGHDLSGGGTLTKTGTGTLIMPRPNNGFTGTLVVDGGKLVASAFAGWRSADLRIASGGTFRVTAANGLQYHNKPIVVKAGGKLELADGLPSNIGPGALSTLQIEGGAELASGTPDPTWGSWVINTAGYGIDVAGGTGAAVISARNITPAAGTLTLEVADVTGDAAADLLVSG